MVLHVGQLLLDITIFLGMLIAETQVLKLFLYFGQFFYFKWIKLHFFRWEVSQILLASLRAIL